MKTTRLYILLALLMMAGGVTKAQVRFDWQWGYGSMGDDVPYFILKTDEGYFVGGNIDNDGGFNVECEHNDQRNGWLIKLNEAGELVDQSCVDMEVLSQISQSKTNPNHYFLGGIDPVGDGSVACVIKMDEQMNVLWKRVYGNPAYTSWYSPRVTATNDGGCIVSHSVAWNGGDISHYFGSWDTWVFKLDSLGNMQWETTLGTEGIELAGKIQEMEDDTYTVFIMGSPQQFGSLYSCNQLSGVTFGVVAKLDPNGNMLGNRCYGGYSEDDSFCDLIVLEDGYLYWGMAESNDGDLEGSGYHLGYVMGIPHYGRSGDAWLMKTDFDGNVVWSKCYGGSLNDAACKVFQNEDGGFTVAGLSESRDGDVQSAMQLYPAPDYEAGPQKPWIFRTDAEGNLLWERVMGADVASTQYYADAVQVSDKEFVFVCQDALYPPPYPYGDINCPNVVVGSQDNYWVFHLTDIFDYDGVEEAPSSGQVVFYPNPGNDVLNIRTAVTVWQPYSAQVEIYDVMGRLTYSRALEGCETTIETDNWPSGMYFWRVLADGKEIGKGKWMKKNN